MDRRDFELKETKCMQNDAPPPRSLMKGSGACWRGAATLARIRSVGESLAGLFPAAGGAPHVPVLHPVHLTALLPFTAHLPTAEERLRITDKDYFS